MNYERFITAVKDYWALRTKGLKKQANAFLFDFTAQFKESVSEQEGDAILYRFCQEYLDELKFPGEKLTRRHLPFQLTELLHDYLYRACEENKMPQMRWAYQIFGERYDPHDPQHTHDPYSILERAYAHEKCDQQTVELYFSAQLETLWWGQHHFPEGCLITREAFEATVRTARQIIAEKSVDEQSVAALVHYEKLYRTYFAWQDGGKTDDFYVLCAKEGIAFRAVPTVYYQK